MTETPANNGHPPRALTPASKAQAPARAKPADELEILIRARYPVIYVVTWEEERLEQKLAEVARRRNKGFHVWTCSQGLVKHGATPSSAPRGAGSTADPIAGLDAVLAHVDPAIFLFKDLHDHLDTRVCRATSATSAGSATSPTPCATPTRRWCWSRP